MFRIAIMMSSLTTLQATSKLVVFVKKYIVNFQYDVITKLCTILNYSQVNKVISSIYIETDTNTLIQTWIEGIGTGTMIPAGESVTFTITISYPGGLTEVPENTQKVSSFVTNLKITKRRPKRHY